MKTTKHTKIKISSINILSITLFVLFSSSIVIAQEPTEISGTDLGSGRIKAETTKPNKKPSTISSGDMGSGRIKIKTK